MNFHSPEHFLDPKVRADAELAEAAHEADGRVDVALAAPLAVVTGPATCEMALPAEIEAVVGEVVLEEELVDARGDVGPVRDGLDDRELREGRVDVDLDGDLGNECERPNVKGPCSTRFG